MINLKQLLVGSCLVASTFAPIQASAQKVMFRLYDTTPSELVQSGCIDRDQIDEFNIKVKENSKGAHAVVEIKNKKQLADIILEVLGCGQFEQEKLGSSENPQEDGIIYIPGVAKEILDNNTFITLQPDTLKFAEMIGQKYKGVVSYNLNFTKGSQIYSTLDEAIESGEVKDALSNPKYRDRLIIEEIDILNIDKPSTYYSLDKIELKSL